MNIDAIRPGRKDPGTSGASMTKPHSGPAKRVIGIIEPVVVRGKLGEVHVLARIDTGASRTTVDKEIADRVGLGPPRGKVRIRQSISKQPETRPLVPAHLVLAGVGFEVSAAVADRQEMKYEVIVGVDILRRGRFLIDPARGVHGRAGSGTSGTR